MPELPEVETVVQGLRPLVEGGRIQGVTLNRPNLRFAFAPDFANALMGREVTQISRRAKYLLFQTDNIHTTLLAHLGMTGNFRFAAPDSTGKFEKHDHVVLELDGHAGPTPFLVYSDPRRFGFMHLTQSAETDPFLAKIGPEPLGNHFHAQHLAERAAKKAQPMKSFLLDQTNVAGLGNIYVCEALWRAKVSPTAPAQSLVTKSGAPSKRLEALAGHIKDVLSEAIRSGGSTLQDYRNVDGSTGYFQHNFAVYDQEGEPCKAQNCKGTIARITQSGRSTFYCKSCQKR